MLSLHTTTELTKKVFKISALVILLLIFFVYTFRLGGYIKNIIFPPAPIPPSAAFGKLPKIPFPNNVIDRRLTYAVDTITGGLPSAPEYPFQIRVYKILEYSPSLLNLERARSKARAIDFETREIPLSETDFKWVDASGPIPRELYMNTVTFNFQLTTPYKNFIFLFPKGTAPSEIKSKEQALEFLSSMQLFHPDIDFGKTRVNLLEIKESTLSAATSLSEAQFVSVNFYQKNIAFAGEGIIQENIQDTIDMAVPEEVINEEGPAVDKNKKDKLPIYYPNPPNSTINFLVAKTGMGVIEANYKYQGISNVSTTYPLKTAFEAFEELRQEKGYIAAFPDVIEYKDKTEIRITNVSLGYYANGESLQYLMPVVVFSNEDGFFAYVSAIQNSWIEQ